MIHKKRCAGTLAGIVLGIMLIWPGNAQAIVHDTSISGGPPSTEIDIFGPEGEKETHTKTDDTGQFHINCIPGERYTVARADGREPDTFVCKEGIGLCLADFNAITLPIIRNIPPPNKEKSAVNDFARKPLGMFGGGSPFGGGNSFGGGRGSDGASMVRKPKIPWYVIVIGKTELKIGGWVYNTHRKKKQPVIRIAQRITDSPDKGAPDNMWLQNGNGNILRPVGYMIFELWRNWRLTITITRESYVDGKLVNRSVTRESTTWKELEDTYKVLLEAPSIWERLVGKPFNKLRGVIVEFPLQENFNPTEWSLITHVTSKTMINGKEVIRTVPAVMYISQGKKNRLRFKPAPDGKTQYQQTHECSNPYQDMNKLMDTIYTKNEGQKKQSKHKTQKTKMDAAHWARILILQPPPTDKWLKAYHSLSQKMKIDGAVAMADAIFRIVTGTGVDSWNPKLWEKEFSRINSRLRNMAIMAANRWKHGMNEKQKQEVYRSYSKLPPPLQNIFQREFVSCRNLSPLPLCRDTPWRVSLKKFHIPFAPCRERRAKNRVSSDRPRPIR